MAIASRRSDDGGHHLLLCRDLASDEIAQRTSRRRSLARSKRACAPARAPVTCGNRFHTGDARRYAMPSDHAPPACRGFLRPVRDAVGDLCSVRDAHARRSRSPSSRRLGLVRASRTRRSPHGDAASSRRRVRQRGTHRGGAIRVCALRVDAGPTRREVETVSRGARETDHEWQAWCAGVRTRRASRKSNVARRAIAASILESAILTAGSGLIARRSR